MESAGGNRGADERSWLYQQVERAEPFCFQVPEYLNGLPNNANLHGQVTAIVDHYNSQTLSFGLHLTLVDATGVPSCVSYERRGRRLVVQYNYDFQQDGTIHFYLDPQTGNVYSNATTGTVLRTLTYGYRLIVEFERLPAN